MKPRHWQRIMEVIDFIFELESEGFCLKNILEADVYKRQSTYYSLNTRTFGTVWVGDFLSSPIQPWSDTEWLSPVQGYEKWLAIIWRWQKSWWQALLNGWNHRRHIFMMRAFKTHKLSWLVPEHECRIYRKIVNKNVIFNCVNENFFSHFLIYLFQNKSYFLNSPHIKKTVIFRKGREWVE